MKYYKVVNKIENEVLINTATINYGLTLDNFDEYEHFIKAVTNSSKKENLPFDFYFSLNNNLALWGDAYIDNLAKPINGVYEIFNITNKEQHKGIYLSLEKFIEIVKALVDNEEKEITPFSEGNYLWEYIFEEEREHNHIHKPMRNESFFLFENKEDCQTYIDKHKHFGTICEVELINTSALFRGDMNIYDAVPNNSTFKQVKEAANEYWSGEISKNPIIEILFQGECKLLPI